MSGLLLDNTFFNGDQKTFRPVGGYSSNLVSLIGNLVKNLPLDYDTWEQIPETARVSILPELKGWFNLEPHLNDQTMIRVGKTDKTVGSMVKLGLLQSMKKQFRHFKNKVKAEYFSKFESVEEAKRKMPPEDDWKKGQAAWEKQVDWWAGPKRMEKAAKNAKNRAKKRMATYQGSKSFAQGRHEYFVKKGRYQDLITHRRDRHSHEGVFDNSENEDLYLVKELESWYVEEVSMARMKSIKDQVNARTIEFKFDKEIIAEFTKSTNREHESGVGMRLPIIRQEVTDKERWKKAAEEAKQEAELAKQEAKLANERAARVELVLDKFMGHYNQQQTQAGGRSFTPPPLPTTLVPGTVSTSIPDPYSDPNRYYKVMNPGSSRIPNDDEDGDDQDGNDEDGNANNEDGNGSDESLSESDDE
ncbi:hypothetical protein Tco_1407588 [Tanacetum coccineum]